VISFLQVGSFRVDPDGEQKGSYQVHNISYYTLTDSTDDLSTFMLFCFST
jgi:hypothetical protein